ncbi:MAG: class I SAM-dependent methyltransferase [Actinomycetota bacterium]|nr:class I SAM-dependent methyltransferase [Actinomycetota bacterium]
MRSGRLGEELASRRINEPSPIPPAWLLYLTQGNVSRLAYQEGGRASADCIRAILGEAGVPLNIETRVLDFGCGSGRILRWWQGAVSAQGCDYNPQLAGWCAANLLGIPVARNGARPPTPYQPDSFDLLYAQSVMTHLPPERQVAWIQEWTRIVRPGGMILATFHGPSHYPPAAGLSKLDRVGHFMLAPDSIGHLCAVWNTKDDVVQRVGRDLELVLYRHRGMPASDQDIFLFRVPDRVTA